MSSSNPLSRSSPSKELNVADFQTRAALEKDSTGRENCIIAGFYFLCDGSLLRGFGDCRKLYTGLVARLEAAGKDVSSLRLMPQTTSVNNIAGGGRG